MTRKPSFVSRRRKLFTLLLVGLVLLVWLSRVRYLHLRSIDQSLTNEIQNASRTHKALFVNTSSFHGSQQFPRDQQNTTRDQAASQPQASLKEPKRFPSPNTPEERRQVVVDIISVGSTTQPEQQKAQLATFGSHPSVRHFYQATEEDDTERDCHLNLSSSEVNKITTYCRYNRIAETSAVNPQSSELRDSPAASRRPPWPPVLQKLRKNYATYQWLRKKSNPVGWMCAQKRPVDAFLNAARQYNYRSPKSEWTTNETTSLSHSNLPDYVIIMDDDTWVNMDQVVDFVTQNYPKEEAHAVAGCMIRSRVREHNFTIPYGGYGLLLCQRTVHNFFLPLHCSSLKETGVAVDEEEDIMADSYQRSMMKHSSMLALRDSSDSDDTAFQKLACWRLEQNGIGERQLFRDGMSIADLMHAYSAASPYTQVSNWGPVGFCLHSDWVWGYFINYYHLSKHSQAEVFHELLHDRLAGYGGSLFYAGARSSKSNDMLGQCRHSLDFQPKRTIEAAEAVNGDPFCSINAHLCHRISPRRMQILHKQQQRLSQN